eukprot:7384555-Prymnesium_polylepis.1
MSQCASAPAHTTSASMRVGSAAVSVVDLRVRRAKDTWTMYVRGPGRRGDRHRARPPESNGSSLCVWRCSGASQRAPEWLQA